MGRSGKHRQKPERHIYHKEIVGLHTELKAKGSMTSGTELSVVKEGNEEIILDKASRDLERWNGWSVVQSLEMNNMKGLREMQEKLGNCQRRKTSYLKDILRYRGNGKGWNERWRGQKRQIQWGRRPKHEKMKKDFIWRSSQNCDASAEEET